jgi:hypothetical protein
MIQLVSHVFFIERVMICNQDIDLNTNLTTSDTIKNTLDYDVDKVMGPIAKDGKVIYIVKWKC